MTKQEFLTQLSSGLSGYPQRDREGYLLFYGEMIDDRMEDGMTEEAAVAEIGTADEIVMQIIAETPLAKLVREKIRPKKALRVWEIILLILGSPIWLSLLIAAAAVILAVYVVFWALIVSLWAAEAAICCCALAGGAAGIFLICRRFPASGIALIAAGLVCAGLTVFLFFGCRAATKGILWLTKKISVFIKHCFIKKENKQ